MKIITFWGGLGNQIFEYAYFLWLKEKYPLESFYGFYPSAGLSSHNGLEIDKHFNVKLPPSSLFSNIIGFLFFNINRLLRRLGTSERWTCTQKNRKYDSLFHCDYWQDKIYLSKIFYLEFKLKEIDPKNIELIKDMELRDYVAIHIRRGDFLLKKNSCIFGDICTDDYYKTAISLIRQSLPNVKLLFFSDDSKYVSDTFKYENMQIVDWNKGEKSIFDMYLMSKCTYMILANSTFSYWAARLNKNARIIYCPNKWTNYNSPDIILDDWVKLDI